MSDWLAWIVCQIRGHAEPMWWFPIVWSHDPEVGTYRVNTLVCPRCKGVLEIRSEVEGEPWQ